MVSQLVKVQLKVQDAPSGTLFGHHFSGSG